MSDLISRQNAIDAWNKLSKRGRTEFDQVLMTLPSALSSNKVEVVRCKECKWNTHYPFCDIDRNDDFFCADGERGQKEE